MFPVLHICRGCVQSVLLREFFSLCLGDNCPAPATILVSYSDWMHPSGGTIVKVEKLEDETLYLGDFPTRELPGHWLFNIFFVD